MAERLQILVKKLDKCFKEAPDEEVSQCLSKMKSALDNVLDPLSGDTEWKRDSDDSVANLCSSIIDLVEDVEGIIDSYSLLMSEQKCGKTVSFKVELREISANIRQFLYKERQISSKIIVFFQDMTAHFPNLLNKFSEKVYNEFEKLKMDLYENSKQPGSEAEQMDNRVRVSRKFASTSRQEAAKLSQSKTSKSVTLRGRENTPLNVDQSTLELRGLAGREKEQNQLKEFCEQEKSDTWAIAITRVAGIWKTFSVLSEKLKMDLYKVYEQPLSEADEMDNRMGVSRKFAQPRCGQNHIASKRSTSRQQAAKLLGRENELNELNEFFCAQKKSHFLAVAVTGVAGIGKTSLVGAVCKKVKRQFDCYAWVNMFGKSTSDAVRDMLTLFSKKQPVSYPPCNASTMDEDSLRKALSSFLTEKKFLLVLDDITSEADWTSFKTALPQNNCNGKVVMTSRKLDFSGCRNIELKGLKVKDSCSLLFTEEEASKLSSAEKSVAEEISELCEGIPLAIIIVRSMLSPEKPSTFEELQEKLNNVRKFTNRKKKVGSTNKMQRGDSVNDIISLCYSTLQPMLKGCFLYGALFPPHSKILCRKLIRLWIAEGFVDEKNDMTMEEEGELQLQKLLGQNMFQMVKMGTDGKPKFCLMLRPLQEFAKTRAQDDKFCSTFEIGASLPSEKTKRSVRLSLTARDYNSNMTIDKTYRSQLRSLLLLQGENLQASQMKYFSLSRFKLLAVLDLEGLPIKILPDSLGNLCLLHYLGLRHTQLIELPRSICRLIRLETLDIRDTFVRDLPQDLEQLNKLRHLLLASSFDDNVVNVPIDIASFKDLQTLAGVKLTKEIGENLEELQQLQKLSVGKVKSNLQNQLATSINRMESLRSLTIKCDLGEQIHVGLSGSLTKMTTLRVEGEILDLYSWVKNLKALTHLKLKDCVLTHDPFVELGNMINLVYLSVQNAYVGESIRFQKDCFPSLKKLSIAHFQALSKWYIDDGALKNLEKLIIESCPKLTHLPRYFSELNNFRVMQAIKMPKAFGEEAKQLGEKIEKLSVVVLGLPEAQFRSTTITIWNN